MKAQFTSGPWFSDTEETADRLNAIVNDKGETVADNIYGKTDVQAEANARLICAAPDLLEALQNLLNKDELNQFEAFEVEKKAMAAIKKATE